MGKRLCKRINRVTHPLPSTTNRATAICCGVVSLDIQAPFLLYYFHSKGNSYQYEHVKPMVGDTVAIIGPGYFGMFHLRALKAAGTAKIMVLALDQDKKGFEIAEK